MDYRTFITEFLERKGNNDPSSLMTEDSQQLIDMSRHQDLDERAGTVNDQQADAAPEIMDVDELTQEALSLKQNSEPAMDTATLSSSGETGAEAVPFQPFVADPPAEISPPQQEVSPGEPAEPTDSIQDLSPFAEPESTQESVTELPEILIPDESVESHAVPESAQESVQESARTSELVTFTNKHAKPSDMVSMFSAEHAQVNHRTQHSLLLVPEGKEAEFNEMLRHAEQEAVKTGYSVSMADPVFQELDLPGLGELPEIQTTESENNHRLQAISQRYRQWDRQ